LNIFLKSQNCASHFRFKDADLVKKLIEEGADVNLFPNEYKYTFIRRQVPPLYYATAARDATIVKILLDAGRVGYHVANNTLIYNIK
jgi:ankyrin repeat protein